jgi:hypothetical protein
MRFSDEGQFPPSPARPQPEWTTDPPPDRLLPDYPALSGLPTPVRLVVATALLPLDAAVTSVRILRNTEALLAELVFHLRALRPAVAAASQAYANGQFDPVFKAFDQIQHGTNAIAVIWAPLNAVRDVFVPGQAKQQITAPPPAPVTPTAPTTAEWLGGIGSRVLDQAATLPGGGGLVSRLRRRSSPAAVRSEPEPVPASRTEYAPQDSGVLPVSRFLPGPMRRLFGGS